MEMLLFGALLLSLAGVLVWAYRETLSEDALMEELIRESMMESDERRTYAREEDGDD